MQSKRIDDGEKERQYLVALVVCDGVLARMAANWKADAFRSKWCNIVAEWCIEHYRQYKVSPKKDILGCFQAWAERADKDSVSIVETFLQACSEEWEQKPRTWNVDYTVDCMVKLFRKFKLQRLAETIQGDVDSGRIEEAEGRVVGYTKVEAGKSHGIDLWQDREAWQRAFSQEHIDPLFGYPEAAGQFFHNMLARDVFLAFFGRVKMGKTFWLVDMAWRALEARKKVAFFQVGDMSESQGILRFAARAARHPYLSTNRDHSWPCTVRIPTAIAFEEGMEHAASSFREKQFQARLDEARAWAAAERVMQVKVKSKRSFFKLSTHPNLAVSMHGIRSILRSWEADEWVPDVVVIDYVDNLLPTNAKLDKRESVNVDWKLCSALAKEMHCLVVTASQARARSKSRLLDRDDFSEDHRKLAEANGIVGINMTDDEKGMQVQQLNWIAKREGDFSSSRPLNVATCFPLSNPCVLSCW